LSSNLTLNNIIIDCEFDDRLFGHSGSILRWSEQANPQRWLPYYGLHVNLDDGDEITAVVPKRNHLEIFKNSSKYIAIPNDNWDGSPRTLAYKRHWTVDGIGCIAPRSIVQYNGASVYLSKSGVVHEVGSEYNSFTSNMKVLSHPIENLLRYAPDEKEKAVGAIKDDKYWLSFPDKDTTYVYDFVAGGWSIYDYAFTQTTFYDTIHTDGLIPSSDMLFINGSTDRIFKADTTNADSGQGIVFSYKTRPIGPFQSYKSIEKMGLFCRLFSGSATPGVDVMVYDMVDSLRHTFDGIDVEATLNTLPRYELWVPGEYASNYFTIQLTTASVGGTYAPTDSLEIYELDIWLQDKGDNIIE
jgi:hypothetical protein